MTALDAASGLPFLDRFDVPNPVKVLFAEEEDSQRRLAYRLRRLVIGRSGLGPDGEYLRFLPRCGLNLASKDWRENLKVALKDYPADLLIIDVVRRVFRGDVKESRDVATFLRYVDEFRDELGCAVLLVHHTRKGKGEEESPVDDILGSTDFGGWLDVVLKMTRLSKEEGEEGGQYKLQIIRKDGDEPESLLLNLEDLDNGGIQLRCLGGVKEVRDAKTRSKIAEAIANLRAQGVTELTLKELAEQIGVSRNTLTHHLAELLAGGLLRATSNGGRWPKYALGGEVSDAQ
jgi:DNA-binding transcriptional ArsR family regulator